MESQRDAGVMRRDDNHLQHPRGKCPYMETFLGDVAWGGFPGLLGCLPPGREPKDTERYCLLSLSLIL
ncbi:hypothetical protein Agabi119p4_3892 [Agaricus bisporus var. burnettii]|uniref:Uncharacterized protein n=1 Tax=Agaricus bisporus var. burnettii TaxID=192524 RepID=A0A8H7KIJ6_AGABI|nr:hypothetical protein Agabi119p4_3892 [Agaricus bisporus var. burnettii]